jgi:zinc transport system ATP-binding protein
MPPAVNLENVSFAYQDFPVLSDVSCSVDQGQFAGIIGPNGGGKTTLLKLIMGFLKLGSGKIEIQGRPNTLVLDTLAYVPQNARYDKQFPISVLEVVLQGRLRNLPWYGIFSAADVQAACNALEKVGLLPFKNRAFGTLSGGQAQRTLIARALASDPSILLLDEPTSNVDTQAQAEIYALLGSLRGSMTILMVTHDLNIAIQHVDKVICVQNKVITLKPQEVCEHFAFGLYHTPLITEINRKKFET